MNESGDKSALPRTMFEMPSIAAANADVSKAGAVAFMVDEAVDVFSV